jgi:CRISPR/Cas system CSM-associated protein Csm3 (group 7 of RAMP superfamily)
MNGTPQRLNITYRIVWNGDWHAGSGEGSASVDRLVRRLPQNQDGERLPYLPGSQLKGVLRHQCERLAALLGCEVVSPHHGGGDRPGHLLQHFGPLERSGLIIDRLFGNRYQGNCLFVDDALPESSTGWPAHERSRTAIDRLSHTARDRTLFVSEVVSGAGRALRGVIRARHPSSVLSQFDGGFPLEYDLLLAGLQTLDSLGGDRSSGSGFCRIEIVDHVWNGEEKPVSEALDSFKEEDWKLLLDLVREGRMG